MRYLLLAAASKSKHLQQKMRPTSLFPSLSISAFAIQPTCGFVMQESRYKHNHDNIGPVAPSSYKYRAYHSSPVALKKKRKNRWKSARKYAAQMERMGEDYDEEPSRTQEEPEPTSEAEFQADVEPEIEAEPATYHNPPDSIVESQTIKWIREVVIGLNLCPFAALPLSSNKLSVEIVRGNDAEAIAAAVLLELILRTDQPGTTVVVAPECHPDDFTTYLEVVSFIEDTLMVEHELHGKVQLAPFHPLFEFGGSGADGVDNYTNRSPYPMFHVLREDEVGAAVDKLNGDAGVVWQRNIKLLRLMEEKLGREGLKDVMGCRADAGVKDNVEEILKMMRDEQSC